MSKSTCRCLILGQCVNDGDAESKTDEIKMERDETMIKVGNEICCVMSV
jgi:hypothetical protein